MPERGARALLFLSLVVWMALAGALLLETIALSLGAGAPRGMRREGASGIGSEWGSILRVYRFFIASAGLFLGYHCFSRRDWARKGTIALIVLDLSAWLGSSLYLISTVDSLTNDPPRMFLQAVVVLFEVGMLRLLLDDSIVRDFQFSTDGVQSSPRT